ncbi:MAG TPA: SDR family oxidoreductase [Clostridiales bacterium]|nr:SDR family oxidoreductase [Clostridiales bacterium]
MYSKNFGASILRTLSGLKEGNTLKPKFCSFANCLCARKSSAGSSVVHINWTLDFLIILRAGIIRREDSLDFSEKNWDDVININLKAVFFLAQAVAKQFVKQKSGGKIINIASMLSFQGGIRVPSYTAAKSGVRGITMTLANEWAKYGINVNAIAPGYMATNNTKALRADKKRNQEILDRIPAGRWGILDDLVGAAIFLASRASDYVNGYTLAVDGGWLAR